MKTIEQLAQAARPTSEEDWGSERQLKAEDLFYRAMEDKLTEEQLEEWEAYSLKATTDETIEYGLALLKR